ncbi:MAG: selenium-dependent molybdenum cofactor biosynthesis protein YqeB [Candidatus Eremiobacteraeota bacterium]|nr:selenium-dependent molybdenum cofactor biosynthesis protein YqeB [Candidatus Eremiobacteraeota bacterium]
MGTPLVVMRGGGDLATGVAHRLFMCRFRPVILELPEPRMVRRTVSFAEAVYAGEWTVEGVTARLEKLPLKARRSHIPVIVDPGGLALGELRPSILIDGRMLKKKPSMSLGDAPLVIGIGPEIEAGRDAHVVIETQRGMMLGREYRKGKAIADTGVPGELEGRAAERVLRAPCDGIFKPCVAIGDRVSAGDELARVGKEGLQASFDGVVRGLLKEGLAVRRGEKLGDLDGRFDVDVSLISDKARAIGGSVLEAIFSHFQWTIINDRRLL